MNFCIMLDNKGHLYSFGKNEHGQLGQGHVAEISNPNLIETLAK